MAAKKAAPAAAKKAGAKKAGAKKKAAPARSAKNQAIVRGKAGFDKASQQDAQRERRRARMVPRLWLPPKGKKRIIFIDDDGCFIHEHNIPVDGKYGRNFMTCLREVGVCPICQSGNNATFTAYFTIIDVDGWTDREGKEHRNVRMLYPAKGSTIQVMKKLILQYKGLVGRAFTVERIDENDSNCGRDFTLIKKKPDMTKLPPKDRKAFDYDTVFELATEDELATMGYVAADDDEGGAAPADEGGEATSTGVGGLL